MTNSKQIGKQIPRPLKQESKLSKGSRASKEAAVIIGKEGR